MNTGKPASPDATSSLSTPADYLFVVMSGDAPLSPSFRFCLRDVRIVRIRRGGETRGERAAGGEGTVLDLTLADSCVSERHAELHELDGAWSLVDQGATHGTRKNGEMIAHAALADGDVIEVGRTQLLLRRGLAAAPDVEVAAPAPGTTAPLTLRPDFEHQLHHLRDVARSETPILLLGETGTGKEIVARAVHAWSGRGGRFIPINCGAIPANLLESELFGYARGAFTGAQSDRPGLIETAHQGTLLLDEIGELSPAAQAAVLRVLQEREVWPVGARQGIPVDIRVVCATHQDLDAMVAEGRFREDLYARLAGFSLRLPPLRERREDLGLLVAALVRRHQRAGSAVAFTRAAMRALLQYRWPRNVRELERCIEVALALSQGRWIEHSHLPPAVRDAAPVPPPKQASPEERFRAQLVTLLQLRRGNVSAVARDVGLTRMTLTRRFVAFGIDPTSYRAR